jgi:glutathione synthase/RimK-type ligase-like ATP-grasp enzyme
MFLKELRNLLSPDVLWFPGHPYTGAQEWQNRLSEFKMASELGISVPETLTTNDPIVANEFLDRLNSAGKTILFREYSVAPANILPVKYDANSPALRKELREKLRNSPCTFQEYVEKKYEYRVVVFRDRCFPVRIHSQNSVRAKEDWRVMDDQNVKWELARFPKALDRKLQAILRRLELNLGSFDFIESTDGKLYMLEVNRPGNFYWLLGYVGLDVGLEMADYLSIQLRKKKIEE